MALNPIVFTEKVVRSFLRYQLTAYPFADVRLHAQMRKLLSLDETRESPLLRGPYVSLSRPFRQGAAIDALIREGVLHSHMRQRIPQEITQVYGHQEEAIRAIRAGRTTLISTGTGSGKTECFLYPIVSKCLQLRDDGAAAGICAVIVYPMNALAEDQLGRLRSLLAGTRIPFGMYVGKTPDQEGQVVGVHLPEGASRADYEAQLARSRKDNPGESVYPAEEVCSREMMRTPGKQPRILLTNVKQLELLLTRQKDVNLFADARLDFLVFDEAHTFTGAQGAETACLIRRLRAFCGRDEKDTVCVATSATIVDREKPDAAREFATRFFGVPADRVATVGETYERQVWAEKRTVPPKPAKDMAGLLASCVSAVEDESGGESVRRIYRELTGSDLPAGDWAEALHAGMSRNELVFQLSEVLGTPRELADLPAALQKLIGRPATEPEILTWLTLGAAARSGGRPLLRPVVHGFLRGISGAVVSFPDDQSDPRLWLAAEDEIQARGKDSPYHHFPVTTCTTCGQHYFIAYLKDFVFHHKKPEGGDAKKATSVWEPLEETLGGARVVLIDRIVGESEDESPHERTAALQFCRRCGAAHPEATQRCLHCGTAGKTVELFAVRQNEDNPGVLTSCLSCGSNGRRFAGNYREPARPVRATNVADVHVLAQDMVHHSERPRLLVFCDNRQDAAFQAGWMKDHARRFRLRALMANGMQKAPVSVGDLALHLDDVLAKDESLSRALVPEVWQVARKEGSGGRHEQERRKFLRFQVLREVTLSSRQPIGLEPWGRMKIEYEGLEASLPWVQQHAKALGLPPDDLRDGVASLLDYLRRKRVLHDPDRGIFAKYWMDGDPEVQQGYLPQLGNPIGTKLKRGPDDKSELVTQWIAKKGETPIRRMAKKWGVEPKEAEEFLTSLFKMLVDEKFLVPVRLKGSKGNPLPKVSGVHQVDGDRMRLTTHSGVWRCKGCRRRTARKTPHLACPAWRCEGFLEFVQEDPDNYDLQLLDEGYSMLRPEEHTAMVPHDERERLENLFKGDSEAINTFVCTPTLELGVDIGQLDAVLMRNVPPLPANYWQRAGRAGRRHRMAVDLTYCRPVSHDRAYFAEPLKLLSGRIDPPAFNLRNELMVAKHVHATVITRLHQYVRDESKSKEEREAIGQTLTTCLPDRISSYLFDEGVIRDLPFDLAPLRHLIQKHALDLTAYVARVFVQGWPKGDAAVATPEALRSHVDDMVVRLDEVVARLRRRLRWAMDQLGRLHEARVKQGSLEREEDALFRRCDALIKRLKGASQRTRREAEGYDDVNTFGVLAAEGFLPGYGLEVGSILGLAEIPFWRSGAMDFSLPRPPSVALREYVPGNLIYANGNKFAARRFHRDADEQRAEMPTFEVSTERQAVKPTTIGAAAGGLGAKVIQAISVCDVDLIHQSHISDEEELRFQMGVSVYGLDREQHNGGTAFSWGEQSLHHRRGVRLRLVNVGASSAISRSGRFGYPICTVCGQSVSPFSSDKQRDEFQKQHHDSCGKKVNPVGFYADVVADVLSLNACPDQATAFSVLESIRFSAARVLDMHLDDLQVLVLGHVDRDQVDGLLWDPMPGGSGLLDQISERFPEISKVAREIVASCPAACETSCIDCLQTFRNGYYHKYLSRKAAEEKLSAWGHQLTISHPIPAKQPAKPAAEGEVPVNVAEDRLRHLLLGAGFEEGVRGRQLKLDKAIGTTTPDVIYRAADHGDDEGICIYIDGLSKHIHGNARTAEQDKRIRSWLRGNGWEVIEISYVELDDPKAMTKHFRKLAGYLGAKAIKEAISADPSWFEKAKSKAKPSVRLPYRVVQPTSATRYKTCVPLLTIKAAAGGFGDQQLVEEAEWVEPESDRKLSGGMFVAQVVGESMEPRIPNGSFCLFKEYGGGSRQGKIVLARHSAISGLEAEGGFTIKRYESKKQHAPDGTWRHIEVVLHPENPAFPDIRIEAPEEDDVVVVAEFLEVLKCP